MIRPTQRPAATLLPQGDSSVLRTLQETNSLPSSSNNLKKTFQEFVGGTFYQLMLKSLHEMHDKPAYLHGGQAEDIFQSQLDQEIATHLAHTSGAHFSEGLFQQFRLKNAARTNSNSQNANRTNVLDITA